MLMVAFIIAVITGLILAVVLWRMPVRKKVIACLLEEEQDKVDRENDAFKVSKEYLVMKRVIRC